MIWRIKANDHEYEAPDTETLKTWIKEKRIRSEHYVYHPVLEKWMYVRDVEELRPLLAEPAINLPPQPQKIIVEQKKKTSPVTWGCLVLIVIFVFIGIMTSLSKKSTTTQSTTTKQRDKYSSEIKAAIRFTGTQFVIQNNDAFRWTNCKFSLNRESTFGDAFEYEVSRLEAGHTYTVGVMQFAKPDGTRFNPFQMKPKILSVFCDEGNYVGGWK